MQHILTRFFRTPGIAIAVTLFACIVTFMLCGLQASNEAEIQHYEEVYKLIPVELTVTNLTATKSNNLNAPEWVVEAFTEDISLSLREYVKDVRIKAHRQLITINGLESENDVVGITAIQKIFDLDPEYGGSINWIEGYDEHMFSGEEILCVIPQGLAEYLTELMLGDAEIALEEITLQFLSAEEQEAVLEQGPLNVLATVVGTYVGNREDPIYCSYLALRQVCRGLEEEIYIDSLSTTLADNDLLKTIYNVRGRWFAEPSALGEKQEWGRLGYTYYPYALDIDDTLLLNAASALENSITINQICTLLVFLLSTCAGFFIGFLMVRQRKREIFLMRTLGTRDGAIYFGFAVEQMLCVFVGALLGGAVFLWHPLSRLAIFVAIYFVSLTVAIQIFLRSNLLTTMKEDE